MFGFRRRRRDRLRARPMPASWPAILDEFAPYASLLPDEVFAEVVGHMHVLLAEKHFEGCDGFEMREAVRVTIAFHAALLLLGRPTDYYPTLQSVLVYPTPYVARRQDEMPDGTVIEGEDVRLGESWAGGAIVLSWADVVEDASLIDDGFNVVLHEFAHQLDGETGDEDGAPPLPDRATALRWREVMTRSYGRLQREVKRGRDPLLDPYGAEHPAEFFAVITETFFEAPIDLREEHPDVYGLLRTYYRADPASWFEAAIREG